MDEVEMNKYFRGEMIFSLEVPAFDSLIQAEEFDYLLPYLQL